MPVTFTGSYGQPIVMGLTPFTKTRVRTPGELGRTDWPPEVDAERLANYELYEALVENRAGDVFEDLHLKPDQRSKIVLAAALPELLCNVWADSIWTDAPTIELPTDAAETAWAEINEANEFSEIRGWESIFGAAMRGTSVLRLYISEELAVRTGDPVQIEEVSPAIFFPKLRQGSDRWYEWVVLAWAEMRPGGEGKPENEWHVRELHELIGGKYTITKQERRASESEFKEIRVETTTLDFLPFVDLHAKRWSGRYWGLSELARNVPIFDEIDNTLSNIAEILEYHGKPMLQVPFSSLFGGVLSKGADRTLAIRNPAEAEIARYITYDGQIDAQVANLDKLTELAFLVSEVPRTYFGLGLEGGAPSGVSLRLQLQNYLKKAARWQRAETRRLKVVVDFGLRMREGFDEKARLAKVTHGSPLPADDVQEASTEVALHEGGLSSRKTSIRRLRRVPADEIDAEIAAIESEEKAKGVPNTGGGPPAPAGLASLGLPVVPRGRQEPATGPQAGVAGGTAGNTPERA